MIIQSALSQFHIRLFHVQPEEERRRVEKEREAICQVIFHICLYHPNQVAGTRRGAASQAKTIHFEQEAADSKLLQRGQRRHIVY